MRNGIHVTGKFIKNTRARGCFIVFQSDNGSPDVFRSLLRPNSSITVADYIRSVPPSTYQMFVHDMEHDGCPNESPALISKDILKVTHGRNDVATYLISP